MTLSLLAILATVRAAGVAGALALAAPEEDAMLHTADDTTCPIVDAPDDYHFELRCEDCDVATLAHLTLGQVEDRYHVGRITQDEYEAYLYAWATLSPSGSHREWRADPEYPAVRRIARKLLQRRAAVAR